MNQFFTRDRLRLLLDHFAAVGDPREACKVKYPLREVLFLVTCASIAGCDDYDEIAAWGAHHHTFLKGYGEYFFGDRRRTGSGWFSTASIRRCSKPVSRPGPRACGPCFPSLSQLERKHAFIWRLRQGPASPRKHISARRAGAYNTTTLDMRPCQLKIEALASRQAMDVGDWLRRIGFGQYEAAFRDNGIGEAVLPHLTVDDLKEIGVATVGDRRMLLAAIAALASPTAPEPTEAAASARAAKKAPEVSAERRPVTVMFCDLVGSTEPRRQAGRRGLAQPRQCLSRRGLGRGDWPRRPCAEEARRRADGALRLSKGPGERRRARGAGRAGHPARARGPQCKKRRQRRAGASRAYRHRERLGRR